MQVDWKKMRMSFKRNGNKIELKAVHYAELKLITCRELYKSWRQGGQLMMLSLSAIERENKHDSIQEPELKQLMHKFEDVFQEPKALPPKRELDH